MIDNNNDFYRIILAIWLDMFCMYMIYFFCEFWFWKKHTELKLEVSMIDSNFIFLRDCLDAICDDIQDRQLQTSDPELLRLLDAIYPKLSYSYQRVNNYIIIHKEDKI